VENLLGPLFIHLRGRVLTNFVSSVVRATEDTSSKRRETARRRLMRGVNRPFLRLSSLALAPEAWAYALHGGAEVVGGDGEGRELVGGYPLLEIAEVYSTAHAD
jgi:hypothetical protein